MNCDSPADVIACAIRESLDTGTFEVFAYLIVPGIIGLVTLVVAVASFVVARASFVLSRSIVLEGKKAEQNRLKYDLAERVFQYTALRWSGPRGTVEKRAKETAELDALSLALLNSQLPGAGFVQDLLWQLDKHRPKHGDSPRGSWEASYVAGHASTLIARVMRMWFSDPDNLDAAVALAIEDHKAADARATKESKKEMKPFTKRRKRVRRSADRTPADGPLSGSQ